MIRGKLKDALSGRAEWERLIPELGLLAHFDRAALVAYCGVYALWAEATAAIQKYGSMVTSPSGYPVQSPYIGIANRHAGLMVRLASEFGFTPARRSRISSPSDLPLLTLFGSNADL